MKNLWVALLFSSLFAPGVRAMDMKDVTTFGYARAGTGTNTFGGDQECFYNQGAGGWGGIGRNEFRLGNECTNYLELALTFHHVKTESQHVYTQFRIANSHNGDDATESSNQSTNFVEAFAEMSGVTEMPWSFWVGKRFYRDQDVFIDDYYYFGSMNGNGGGVGNIDLLGGKLSFAYLKRVTDTRTNLGKQGVTVYDARLKNIQHTSWLKQNVWLAYGHAPESTNASTNVHYEKSSGFVVGTLLDFDLNGKGFNHLALMYGQGVMNNFNLYGDSLITAGNVQSKQKRLRFINHTTFDVNEKWAFHLALSHERFIEQDNTKEQWLSLGARPMYRVTKNFHLLTEVGSSLVQSGGTRRLTRLTFAPQLSVNENIWGRPVLRAFYTHSFWNKANQSNVAQNAPTYANKLAGGSYGLQMETFF